MKQELAAINNELQQIYVRGIDAVHMAKALMTLEELYNKCPEEEKPEEKQD